MKTPIFLLIAVAGFQAPPGPQRTPPVSPPPVHTTPAPADAPSRASSGADANAGMRIWLQPLATLIGAMATAFIAFSVMRLQRRRDNEEWYKNFRSVHADFWAADPVISHARQMIANREDYDVLRPLLVERLKLPESNVPSERYRDLEALDRFFAVLVRMKVINSGEMDARQRELWQGAHFSYWIRFVHDDSRAELREYVRRYWPGLVP